MSELLLRQRTATTLLFLTAVLMALFVYSLTLGRYPVSATKAVQLVFSAEETGKEWIAINIVRLPRVLLAMLCGMGLGLSGAAMQGVFRNPLVGPEIVGVTAAASFGGVLGILLSFPILGIVASSFAFGMGAFALAFGLGARHGRGGILSLVLAGLIVGSLFSAGTGLVQYFADPESRLPQMLYWLLGSFAGATYPKLAVVAAMSLIAMPLLLALRWRINLLSLGQIDARSLGVNVNVLRWSIVLLVALLVAAQVSVSGGVSFVGLIIPHFARMLVGPEHTRLLPASMLLGGIYLLAMDNIARSATSEEIPIGVLTDFVGAVVFSVLFWKYQARGWSRD